MQRRTIVIAMLVGASFTVLYWLTCLPAQLFSDPTCTVLSSTNAQILSARIADDGQWRFPQMDSVPKRFATCLITFEDRNFYRHPGVDPAALGRAALQNFRRQSVVSGASTISMQLMRMSRRAARRSIWQKVLEICWATRAEWRYSKDELLKLYASNAPFGGNVVGLDAASWRYFGRPAYSLSWAECAVLAVLPNAPGLIYPGRNLEPLLQKRNRLLQHLHEEGHLDALSLQLALAEPLPGAPLPLPQMAPQLMDRVLREGGGGTLVPTTIDPLMQQKVQALTDRHVEVLSRNFIHNAAVLVLHIETGEVLAYIGNASANGHSRNEANDMARTPRSTGSILKPFLYGQMLTRSQLAPQQLVPDIPTQYAGFAPKNFDESYSGAVPADVALARSLNIPAVRMLKDYGVPVFHNDLRKMGFSTITQAPGHYGLSLILGGAECTLWDLAGAYRKLAAQVAYGAAAGNLPPAHFAVRPDTAGVAVAYQWPMDAGAAWATAEAMAMVNRPEAEGQWEAFAGAQRIAWKTGTSYGFRDAWAAGFNRTHVVAVWVGNASGEGRPGITGLNAAAPLLFDVFADLPAEPWFSALPGLMAQAEMCSESGMRATEQCAKITMRQIPKASLNTLACPYCRWVHTTPDGSRRMHVDCSGSAGIIREGRFVLPPLQEWFFKKSNPNYRGLPPWATGCLPAGEEAPIRLIYPRDVSEVFMPRDLDGRKQAVVLKAVHRSADAELYWHLGQRYLGSTASLHHMELLVDAGEYLLTLMDADGNRYSTTLVVVE
jgi:penicillin-binding protein 1C